MKRFLPFLLLLLACQDSTRNALEYTEIPQGQIESIFDESRSFEFSYTLTSGSDTIQVLDTLTYSLVIDSLEIVRTNNPESLKTDPSFNSEHSVISSQHIAVLSRFAPTNRIASDSLFVSGSDSVFVTAQAIDSIYLANDFNLASESIEFHFINFNVDKSVENESLAIFRDAVEFNSLVWHSGLEPTNKRLFNIFGRLVVFGGYSPTGTHPLTEEITQELLLKIETEFE